MEFSEISNLPVRCRGKEVEGGKLQFWVIVKFMRELSERDRLSEVCHEVTRSAGFPRLISSASHLR